MKSVLLAKSRAKPKPIGLKKVEGIGFYEVPSSAPRLTSEEIRARLDAFYAKHPRRTLKKGQKSIVEQLREDRDRR
ncbi:hypothetical protein LXT12_12570 [Pelomonas sp. P7]|uniref:Uncharacterized protein n=1 Tax=Pelomonas caseinilytica TaxID=2906763 RepID=A0ABS8XEC9_9BURK|nr:hypothetical protein [Pelomonas sp. P7]MCE4538085.1 hypothetical protein [Pelomonas sp. P7]